MRTSKAMSGGGVRVSAPKMRKGKSRGKKLRSMRIEQAHNGGFIAHHEMDHSDGQYQEPQTHGLEDTDALVDHVKEHFPGGADTDNDGE